MANITRILNAKLNDPVVQLVFGVTNGYTGDLAIDYTRVVVDEAKSTVPLPSLAQIQAWEPEVQAAIDARQEEQAKTGAFLDRDNLFIALDVLADTVYAILAGTPAILATIPQAQRARLQTLRDKLAAVNAGS